MVDRIDFLDVVGRFGMVGGMNLEILALEWTAERIMGYMPYVGALIVVAVVIRVIGWFR